MSEDNAPPFFYALATLDDEIARTEAHIKDLLVRIENYRLMIEPLGIDAANHQDHLRRLKDERRNLEALIEKQEREGG